MILHADFDECENRQFHDCSEHAQCFNLRGTYTCSCQDGYIDLSENPLFPGRVCSGKMVHFKPSSQEIFVLNTLIKTTGCRCGGETRLSATTNA